MFSVNRILVPIDYSDVSRAAVSMAIQVADRHGAELHLLAVERDLDRELRRRLVAAPNDTVIEDGIASEEQALLDMVETEYKRAAKAGSPLGRVPVHTLVVGGEWLEVVLRLIEQEELDLVVIGTHGPKGLKGRLLGPVAQQIAARAPCSVFVVKPHGYPYLTD